MIAKFAFWLESIVEDDPLPDEINIIVFKINSNGKYRCIELLGLENELNLNKVTFRPLEAQFFGINSFLNKPQNVFLYAVKDMIDEAFFSPILKQQYKGRKIYLYDKDFEFLFEVN